MEPIRTTLTSEEADRLLLRILSEPTRAWKFLRAMAAVLDNGTLYTVNPRLVTDAMNTAASHAFTGLPDIVAAEASEAAIRVLPEAHPAELAGDYAARIREAAEALR